MLIGSVLALQKADLGFSSDRFLAARINLSGDAFDPTQARAAYVEAAIAALGSEPGVAAVAATSSVPGVDAGSTVRLVTDAMDGDDHIEAQSIAVTSQFADALGLARDRRTDVHRHEQADPDGQVAMLNEGLAVRLWKGESAVGKRIGIQGGRTVHLDAYRRRDAGRWVWTGRACDGADAVASVSALRPLRFQGDGVRRPRVRRAGSRCASRFAGRFARYGREYRCSTSGRYGRAGATPVSIRNSSAS